MENLISVYRLSPKEVKIYTNFEVTKINKSGIYNIKGVDTITINAPYTFIVKIKKDLFETTSRIADYLEEYGEVVNYVN